MGAWAGGGGVVCGGRDRYREREIGKDGWKKWMEIWRWEMRRDDMDGYIVRGKDGEIGMEGKTEREEKEVF